MLYTIPDYYKEFKCTADKCEDTCCAGWQIIIDEKSMEKYKKICGEMMLSGSLKKRTEKDFTWRNMLRSINWKTDTFHQDENKRCAFLDDNNLCDLYKNLGAKSLCKTCKLYPRHIEEFEGLREISLSVSCPEVARILMERKTPVTYLTYEKEGEEEFDDFDPFLFSILEDARTEMLKILQNRELNLKERTMLVLGMAHDMQVRINRQEMFDCGSVIEKYTKESALEHVRGYLGDSYKQKEDLERFHKELFCKLYKLELLREDWELLLQETEAILFSQETEHYEALSTAFTDYKNQNPDIDIHLEQILVYFLFTYFPGAVYDGEIYAKVQMAVYCVWMIETLWLARWFRNGKMLETEEMTELLYRFSREVEHSDENLKKAEKWMEKKYFLQ